MTEEIAKNLTKQLNVTTDDEGKTRIIFRKAILKGKVVKEDVMNVLMIAARMQVEKYIEKLSRGASLDPSEVKAMKELSDIIKIDMPTPTVTHNNLTINQPNNLELVKASLYEALIAKSEKSS